MKHFTIFRRWPCSAVESPFHVSAQARKRHGGGGPLRENPGRRNSSEKRPVASLNKIATAAVTVDWATATGADLGSTLITAPQTITLVGGPNPMNLQPGDQLTLRDALYSALLGSDNLAALTIADHVGREIQTRRGGNDDPVAAFVGEMNKLGKALGMKSTRFANPHGLERPGTKAYSTAADVARLSIYAMRRNAFNFIVRQKDRQVSVPVPRQARLPREKHQRTHRRARHSRGENRHDECCRTLSYPFVWTVNPSSARSRMAPKEPLRAV